MSAGGAFEALMTEWMRKLREAWIADVEELLRRTGLLTGRISTGALPRGTMISRGAYNPSGVYRVGDVISSGGRLYVAIQAGSGNDPSDAAYWAPLGGEHAIDGPLHTASGLTAGQVLTATSATTFAFAAAPAGSAWSVLTNGDGASPELIFTDDGDVIMTETPR